jgi:hypothetical protein
MRVTGVPVDAQRLWGGAARSSAQALIEEANLEARAGRVSDALRSLSAAVRVRTSSAPFTNVVEGERYASANTYIRMLGLTGESEREPVPDMERIFPSPANTWPGAGAWMRSAATTLRDHLEGSLTERSVALEMMVQIAHRFDQAGDAQAAASVVLDISRSLAADTTFTPRAVSRVLEVTSAIRTPLQLDAMEALLRDGRLEPSLIAPVIRRFATERSPGGALKLGEFAAQHTEADPLLETLGAVADAAGDPARAAYWRDMRATVAQARAGRER